MPVPKFQVKSTYGKRGGVLANGARPWWARLRPGRPEHYCSLGMITRGWLFRFLAVVVAASHVGRVRIG